MGCDGGTIPRRDELVRVKKKPEQKDKIAELAFRWKHCAIRQLPLRSPIVACGLGRLYSKESVLEGLLDRSILPETATHIKNLKDVKNLNLTPNPAFEGEKAKNGGYVDEGRGEYICPVIGLEMNGKYKFCFIWNCGCVISERALKELKGSNCHKCQQPFKDTDVVVLNAEDEDLKRMQENILLRKVDKKSKKKKANGEKNNEETSKTKATEEETETTKEKDVAEASTSKVTNGETKTKKDTSGKKRPYNSKKIMPEDPAYKKVKEDYSVAKDPNASEVLKSIFTTHTSASQQDRAHWVTYNPFYN